LFDVFWLLFSLLKEHIYFFQSNQTPGHKKTPIKTPFLINRFNYTIDDEDDDDMMMDHMTLSSTWCTLNLNFTKRCIGCVVSDNGMLTEAEFPNVVAVIFFAGKSISSSVVWPLPRGPGPLTGSDPAS
jgi:hypothetical protein